MKKWALFLAAVLMISMIFTGCGETSGGTDDTTTTASSGKADVAIKGDVTVNQNNATTQSGDATIVDSNNSTTAAQKPGAADKGGKTTTTVDDKNKDDAFGTVTTGKVKTKAYTIAAKGSKYATGIKMPQLSKSQAKISYMTNTDWKYIQTESSEDAPTAIYHAMTIWKQVYGVDVEIEMVGWGEFTSYLLTSVVAGEAPEVFRWVEGRPKWIQNNLITSLEDKLDLTDPDYNVERMQQETAMYGHLWGAFGQDMNMPSDVIAYNKTKFEKAGETDPMTLYKKGKWNWDQFVKTAKNMTDAANNEYGVTGTGAFYPAAFCMMYMNDDATITLRIKEPEFVKCMQAVWKLYRVENAARRSDEGRSTFPLGQDAMYPTNMKEYCRMMDTAKSSGNKDEFGVVPYPTYNFIDKKNPIGSKTTAVLDGFSISSCPKNMEGAVEFVRLVTKVATNISESLGEFGWAKNYLSNEEKDIFRKAKYSNFNYGYEAGIDGLNDPMNNSLKYPIYINENTEKELPTILADAHSAFTAVIREYEINAGLRQ